MSLYTPKKLLSVDDAAPKESPKDYAIPKEPLKELFNNQTKYRSKPKPEERNRLESSPGISPTPVDISTPVIYLHLYSMYHLYLKYTE